MNRTLGLLVLACLLWATPSFGDPGRGAAVLCYVWANQASPAVNARYEPDAHYSFNAQNRAGGITVTKTATGTYFVRCTGVGGGPAWGPAVTCRYQHMGTRTHSVMSRSGILALQTSVRRSCASAAAAERVEDLLCRTADLSSYSSGKSRLAR
jgi:hypothetical protein